MRIYCGYDVKNVSLQFLLDYNKTLKNCLVENFGVDNVFTSLQILSKNDLESSVLKSSDVLAKFSFNSSEFSLQKLFIERSDIIFIDFTLSNKIEDLIFILSFAYAKNKFIVSYTKDLDNFLIRTMSSCVFDNFEEAIEYLNLIS